MQKYGGSSRRKIALLVCGVILSALVLLFGLTQAGVLELPFLAGTVSAVVTPVQRFVTQTYASVAGRIEKQKTIAQLNEDIAVLTERNKQLEATVQGMNELQLENQRLRELLGVTETTPETDYIAATVVAMDPSGWFRGFTIDKGARDGVNKDDPVLTSSGLVGRVMTVNDRTSTVLAIIDSRSAAAGMVERTRDHGIVRGSLFVNASDELVQMSYLPSGVELTTGDRVITSGLDGIYPKGLYIGTVRSISRDAAGEDRYVVLSPAVDFMHLEDVLVMKTEEVQP